MCMKLQVSAVSRFCSAAMMVGCTPPKKKLFFLSCDLDKDQRSNVSMWKIFPMPRFITANMVRKLPIISETFKGDHNTAVVAVARKLK